MMPCIPVSTARRHAQLCRADDPRWRRIRACVASVGLPEGDRALTDAMALHAPKALRRGAYPAWGVYANVFMGHDGTRVEYRIDGGDWKPMAKVDAPDPGLLVENVRDDLADALRSFDRSPEAEPSTHLWRGALDTQLSAGEHVSRYVRSTMTASARTHRLPPDERSE